LAEKKTPAPEQPTKAPAKSEPPKPPAPGETREASKPRDVESERVQRFETVYVGLWHDDPPPGYCEAAARTMNIFEFEANERAKPAFQSSPRYAEEADVAHAGPKEAQRG